MWKCGGHESNKVGCGRRVSCGAWVGGCVGVFVVMRSMMGLLLCSMYVEHVSLCVEMFRSVK